MTPHRARRRAFLLGSLALGTGTLSGCAPARAPAVQTALGLKSPRVVVIGAGLSGLAVAYRLVASGHDVTVLEAQARPGGRILTVRFSDGLYAEAGAKHVVPDPDLLSLAAEVGVAIVPAPKRGPRLAGVAYAGGHRTVTPVGQEPPSAPSKLSAEEQKLGYEGREQKYFGLVLGKDSRTAAFADELLRYDAMSGADFLRSEGASEGYVAAIDGMLGKGLGEGIETVSAFSLLREMASISGERKVKGGGRVAGGTDRLPQAIADRLGTRVIYDAAVRRLEANPGGARVIFERKGERHALDADRIVAAVPYPVLASIEIDAGFSEPKRRAIRELGGVATTRLWVETQHRFWRDRGEDGDVETDLAVGRVRDESEGQPGQGGILGSYLAGPDARPWSRLTEDDLARRLVDEMDRVHPGLRAEVRSTRSKRWQDDPFARGAYAWFKPGQHAAFGPALARPEGRVHFAGCHTSYRPGFMHGALASARRVVEEIEAAERAAPGA